LRIITCILIPRHLLGKLSHVGLEITLRFRLFNFIKEPPRNDFLNCFSFLFVYKRIIPLPVILINKPLLDKKTSKVAFTQHHPRYREPMILRFLLILNRTVLVVKRGEYFRVIIKFIKVFLMIIWRDLLLRMIHHIPVELILSLS
jgi:hypothetical protein